MFKIGSRKMDAVRAILLLTILAARVAIAEDSSTHTGRINRPTHPLATLANQDILESSGLAMSLNSPNLFWTHNDSGDSARLFAFDSEGRDKAVVSLQGITANDWEDMASFRHDGRGWLLIGDVGDNPRRRDSCQLHLISEPALDNSSVDVHSTINFRYDDGPKNCEAFGVDATTSEILLVSKGALVASVHLLKLPGVATTEVLVAKRIGQLSVPFATGMDVSQDGTRAIIVTYANAFEFARSPGESWEDAFKAEPNTLAMPTRRQGESICYGSDGMSLYLTSERTPTPLWKVERQATR